MATNPNSNEEIIEKKTSTPVATSCLIIACVALIGAIVFQVSEISAYRSKVGSIPGDKQAQAQAKADVADFHKQVTDLLDSAAAAAPPEGAPPTMESGGAKAGGEGEGTETESASEEKTAEEETKAAPPTEEKAAEEKAAEEKTAEEKTAPEETPAEEPAPDEPADETEK